MGVEQPHQLQLKIATQKPETARNAIMVWRMGGFPKFPGGFPKFPGANGVERFGMGFSKLWPHREGNYLEGSPCLVHLKSRKKPNNPFEIWVDCEFWNRIH